MSEIAPDEERKTYVCGRCGAMFPGLYELILQRAINAVSADFKLLQASTWLLAQSLGMIYSL